jgi:tryptophan-rich sensory protein
VRLRRSQWKPAVWAFFGASLACVMGALATDLSPWYYALQKPSWQPPDWLFAPVWTTIFALTAIAGFVAWQRARKSSERRLLVLALVGNLGLNVTWSILFFRVQRPDFALVEVVFLWLSIAFLAWVVWRCARNTSALLLPYLLWVTFAAVLNLSIVRLNMPMASF